MSKELHEKASSILALVIDLDRDNALEVIQKECKENEELKKVVLELYNEMTILPLQETKTKAVFDNKEHKSRYIDLKDSFISFTDKVRYQLFNTQNTRLAVLIIGLLSILLLGFFTRNSIKQSILQSEIEEKLSINNNTTLRIDHWIEDEKRKAKEMANSPIFIKLSSQIDSLSRLDLSDNSYKKAISPISQQIIKLKEIMGFEDITIIHKSELKIIYNTFQASTSLLNKSLGKDFYDYFMKLKEGETVFISPIPNSKSLQKGIDDYWEADCAVATPILSGGKVIGYLTTVTNAVKQFSNLFKSSQYDNTSETYALNRDFLMISESRFTPAIYQNHYLSKPSSIYSIQEKVPNVDLMIQSDVSLDYINAPLTVIGNQINTYLNNKKLPNEGAIRYSYLDYRGEEVIGVWKWLDKYNFGIITKQDTNEVFSILKIVDLILFILFLIIGGLSFMVYHSNFTIAKFNSKVNRLGQFKIIEKIGEGGFGDVYKGEHALLKMPVAIKLLKENLSTTENNIRFEKEVRATSKLKHPNTIKIYDFGTSANGSFYYIMEYIEGVTLSKIIEKEENIPFGRVIHILLQISYSLREAHHQNLIHRDIKPANIILSKQGELFDSVKLLDFGLVKDLDTKEKEITAFHQIGGTPLYMAPERFHNPLGSNNGLIDIYALGIIGIAMLGGTLPIELISQKAISGKEAFNHKVLLQIIDRKDIPIKIIEVLSKSIHFNPSERTSTIDLFIQDLKDLQEDFSWNEKEAKNWWKTYDVYH